MLFNYHKMDFNNIKVLLNNYKIDFNNTIEIMK